MSLFDIFNKKNIGETLGSLMDTAKEQASGLTKATPGGVGGLVGAGALGALLGSFMSKGALQNAALVGAGAVAWNFYQKWSQSQKESQPAEPAPVQQPVAAVAPAELDPTARLLLRAMVFAARADGHIDATEQERISDTGVLPSHIPVPSIPPPVSVAPTGCSHRHWRPDRNSPPGRHGGCPWRL